MDDLASREGLRHINLTDKDARLMKDTARHRARLQRPIHGLTNRGG